MNKCELSGMAAKDAEVRIVKDNLKIVTLNLCTNDATSKDKTVSNFHKIVCFGKSADSAEFIKKGDAVNVTGSLRSGSYTTTDGVKKYTYEVNALSVEVIDKETTRKTTRKSVVVEPEDDGQLPF